MKLREYEVDIYNNSGFIINKNISFYEKSWIIVLISLISLFIIFMFIPFNIYKTYNGYIEDNYMYLILENKDFPVNKSNKLYIDNNLYKYKIISIENNIVVIDIELDEDINIENNTFKVNVLKSRTSILKIIKNKIKKGFGL